MLAFPAARSLIAALLAIGLVACSDSPSTDTPTQRAGLFGKTSQCDITLSDYDDPSAELLDRWDIDRIMRGDIIDAPVSVIHRDGRPPLWILPTAMQQAGKIYLAHTFISGDIRDYKNADVFEINENDLFEIPEELVGKSFGRHWITNTLQTDAGVFAFLHSEYTRETDFFGMGCVLIEGKEQCAPGLSRISLAWIPQERLDNDDLRFIYLGHIAGMVSDLPHFNVHGTPVYLTEQEGETFVNILFADIKPVATEDETAWKTEDGTKIAHARTPLSAMIEQAKTNQLSTWKKRDGAVWNDAIGGESSRIIPPAPQMEQFDSRLVRGRVLVHSDAVFHEPSNAYILSAYTLVRKGNDAAPSSLVFYRSCDGMDWEFVNWAHPRTETPSGWSYLAMFGRDDSDGASIDADLDLITGWNYGKPDRSLLRMEMTVSPGCACP